MEQIMISRERVLELALKKGPGATVEEVETLLRVYRWKILYDENQRDALAFELVVRHGMEPEEAMRCASSYIAKHDELRRRFFLD